MTPDELEERWKRIEHNLRCAERNAKLACVLVLIAIVMLLLRLLLRP